MRVQLANQAPAGYDQSNTTGNPNKRSAIRQRMQDSGFRFLIHPNETAAGLVDANLTFGFDPGDQRRYGIVGDGATDSTALAQSWLNACAGAPYHAYAPNFGNFVKLTGRTTGNANTHIRMDHGAEMKWTATGATGTNYLGSATRPGIEILGDNFLIEGRGKITGPGTAAANSGAGGGGVTAFVSNEFGLFRKGASAAARGTGLIIRDIEMSLWGHAGIVTQYVADIQVLGTKIHDVGYAGMLQTSALHVKEYRNIIYGVAPGSSGNAYGISHTHDSSAYNTDPLVQAPISGITQASPAVITITTVSGSNPYAVGQNIKINDVGGMLGINGQEAAISAIGGVSGAWTVSVPINAAGFAAFVLNGTITAITQASQAVVTINSAAAANPYAVGQLVNITGVVGMVQINSAVNVYPIVAVGGVSGAWTLTLGVNSSAFTAYTSGGTLTSQASISCPRQALNPFCIDMDCAYNVVFDIPLWNALDAHGCYEGRYHHNTIYNCHRGFQISSSSGNANNYCGENNRIESNQIFSGQRNGNATTDANGFQAGIVVNGGSGVNSGPIVKHRGVIVRDNLCVGLGHANVTPTVYVIEASFCDGVSVVGNRFSACVGRMIYMTNSSGIIEGNQCGSLGASATGSNFIYPDSNCGPLLVKGNVHAPSAGTLTPLTNGLNTPGVLATRIEVVGNDFAACTNPYTNFNGTMTRNGSDITPYAIDSVTGAHTFDVSIFGSAPEFMIVGNQSVAANITDLVNGSVVGQRCTVSMVGSNTLTITHGGAHQKCTGGVDAALTSGSNWRAFRDTAGVFQEKGRSIGNA